MNIHEHQAKEILKEFGAPVSNGVVILSTSEINSQIKKLNTKEFVLKAQIHAGGRGKAGGVKLIKNISDLEDFSYVPPIQTITPPSVKDDYWNVIENEYYHDMTLHKFGRGYLLKCEENHPDYGIKYYPSEENCKAWWQPSNQSWFVRRENKNYFLERGATFIYRENKRVKF